MHRGSSKEARTNDRASEILPLSASPSTIVRVEFVVARAGRTEAPKSIDVPLGSSLKSALRAVGQSSEGCAVLLGETPVPLDLPIDGPGRFTILPTFSGG